MHPEKNLKTSEQTINLERRANMGGCDSLNSRNLTTVQEIPICSSSDNTQLQIECNNQSILNNNLCQLKSNSISQGSIKLIESLKAEKESLMEEKDELNKKLEQLQGKYEKLTLLLRDTSAKYREKIDQITTETGKTIDSLLVKVKIIKDINEELLNKNSNMDTFTIDPPIQTNAFDELFPFLVEKTPPYYVNVVFKNCYISLLRLTQMSKVSNEIHHEFLESFLRMLEEKSSGLTSDRVFYFRAMIREFHNKTIVNHNDNEFFNTLLAVISAIISDCQK